MATKTINDLYLKYVNKVGRTLESDRYFQYLYEMVQAGENVLQQNNQVLHKVVDERWLSTIEESLDSINRIIDKPRRFVTTKEEVVPVALAKKITADSVRHLSMNTQFIASDEDGDIQPTRVLNVSTEESYDLYENRFVYHLIQRLVTFIDKRTDVIFWSTGDETQNVLSYQSKVDDAYEEIEYKIEMKIKNRQSFAENDADNMNVFMRIDRVRRMVMSLKNSSFCDLMAGCAKVRSPIQRTNLIMKDPDYRTCYKLWQFLESYDEVGYTIEVENEALSFDEEYLIQMYTNLITNYTVFKSLLEDERKLDDPLAKKRRVIKPKFIKKIKEEIVDDYNIEDVEIRQVIIEEVTQAQLDAEAKLAEETEARKQAQEALEEMDSQMIFLQQQVSNLMMMNQEAEVRAAQEQEAKEQALAEIEALKEQSQAEIATVKEQSQAEIEAVREQSQAEIATAKEQSRVEIEALKEQSQAEIATVKEQSRAEIEAVREQSQAEIETVKAQSQAEMDTVREQAREATAEADNLAEAAQKETEEAQKQLRDTQHLLEEAKEEADRILKETKAKADMECAVLQQKKEKAERETTRIKKQLSQELTETKRQLDESERRARSEKQKDIEEKIQTAKIYREQKKQDDAQIESLSRSKAELERQLLEANAARAQLEQQLSETLEEVRNAKEREQAANERADANTLSHYIISALNERKRRNEADQNETGQKKT